MATKSTKRGDKPTQTMLIAKMGTYYGKTLQGLQGFAETYVLGESLYGREFRKEAKEKYPLYTDAMWTHIEKIGKHELLPQFMVCSDSMIAGILRLKDSMQKQMTLVAATEDGKIETVSSTGKIVLKSLADLSKADELGIVFAMSEATNAEEIRKFAYVYRQEWRKTKEQARPDDYEVQGDFIKINHAIKQLSKTDWLEMGKRMGWTA